ncbi:FAD-dependent oxidoreductase [Candidatus Woesebacteria bacterium]|nr:FAD-dependent oxidoreductase [Candidatus Woesebacteria bacterium]
MKLILKEIRDEAKGTKSFFFEPEKPIEHRPGQFMYLTLKELKYPDEKGATRHLTISSSPTEGNLIRFTTRIREESGFKKSLSELPVGSEIEGEGPHGTFIISDTEVGPHIFLAGGIGITPFRSIIKYITDKKLPHEVHLIYSNSVPEEIVFRKELEEIAANNSNIEVSMTVSKPEESTENWTGLKGRIDENLIHELAPSEDEVMSSIWWFCGPPPFVTAMEEMFTKLKIPSNNIRVEKFTGY